MIKIFVTCAIQIIPPQTAEGVLGPGRAINMPLLTELVILFHWKYRRNPLGDHRFNGSISRALRSRWSRVPSGRSVSFSWEIPRFGRSLTKRGLPAQSRRKQFT